MDSGQGGRRYYSGNAYRPLRGNCQDYFRIPLSGSDLNPQTVGNLIPVALPLPHESRSDMICSHSASAPRTRWAGCSAEGRSMTSARVLACLTRSSSRTHKRILWGITAVCVVGCTSSAQQATSFRPVIPKVWDEAALESWATPVATLNVRPTHISPTEYYSVPEYNLRSYPVFGTLHGPLAIYHHSPKGGTSPEGIGKFWHPTLQWR